jgi:hypothetical protein
MVAEEPGFCPKPYVSASSRRIREILDSSATFLPEHPHEFSDTTIPKACGIERLLHSVHQDLTAQSATARLRRTPVISLPRRCEREVERPNR